MITQYKRLIKKMQNPTENSIPSNPSNPIEISDNEDINYQINTTSTKNQNRKNVELPYQKSSTSSTDDSISSPFTPAALANAIDLRNASLKSGANALSIKLRKLSEYS